MDHVTPGQNMPVLLGQRLCLNFINTVDVRHSDHPREYLTSYAALVAWAHHADTLTEYQMQQLLQIAAHAPETAERVLQQARLLREALYRIFIAQVHRTSPPHDDVATLNSAVARAMSYARMIPSADGFVWGWVDEPHKLDRMLWPVVRSAMELLTSQERHRVRECLGDDGCGWLFLDTSKNRSRRWCSMAGCGNRAKARRHYQRHRASL
jgi:predicted RNA-binding Zn ribbon-like protein